MIDFLVLLASWTREAVSKAATRLFVIPANSLFSEFNSRLGRKNSLLALLVNCARKRLIWLADFLGK
jgi:hypothetical protein